MSAAQMDPHDKMRSKDMSKVATGQQAPRPAHHLHDTSPNFHPQKDNDESNNESSEEEEVQLKTAPADVRFPTTNQTRHCFTRYIEFHKCIKEKGNDAPECQKFAKYYRSLCPAEWIEKWDEQRELGTFPGPL